MVATGPPVPTGDSSPAPPNVRHVIAVGGGRGGVGKSVLAVNLATYLAQLGRTVVLVDADPSGAELHTMLGVEHQQPAPSGDDKEGDDLATIPTPIPGLLLLPQLYTVGSTVPLRPGRKPRWARGLRQLSVDYVLLDLGAGTAPATLDLFLGADLGVCVTAPEPPSVEATYRFMRALFQRRLRRTLIKDRFKMRLVERAQAELAPMPSPMDLVCGYSTVKLADWISMPDSSVIRTIQLPGVTLKWDQVTHCLLWIWIGCCQTRRPFLIQWCEIE